ncbi:ABC transporter permease [Halalkalibacillus halophilus]|uniref:ABC transporter permease n=1 Tax=Halalkalibacillus halophilus TaxID=392827 RepID=UPI0004071556|nr:ABC transporter permease [Halalkalibacillus halophilus]
MLPFLKKDMTVLVRDRTELLVLLLMPLILTVILGFALRGMMAGDIGDLDLRVAVVMEDDADAGVEQIIDDLESAGATIDRDSLTDSLSEAEPIQIYQSAFESGDLAEMLTVEYVSKSEAQDALEEEEVAAVLTFPDEFTYDVLQKGILDEGDGGEITIQHGTENQFLSTIFEDVVVQITEQFNMELAISQIVGEDAIAMMEQQPNSNLGGLESVTDQDPLSSIQYYAFGMAVMFALYVASTISSKAYLENHYHVFHRIILSGQHPLKYLLGKVGSTTILVFLQMMFLITIASTFLSGFTIRGMEQWAGVGLITILFAFCVGTIAALLTAVSMRGESEVISNIFSFGIVSILAFVGGSFFPTSQISSVISEIGNWVPNGIALNAFLQWTQGLSLQFITPLLWKLVGLSVLFLCISLLVFPGKKVG